jgi:nucleotide-binding universal stress UspA family protein
MRFLVPLDVHGCADKVVDRAIWLAKLSPHTTLDVMTVLPHLDYGIARLVVGDRTFELGGLLDDETAARLRGFAILAQKNHVLGEIIVRNGTPVEQILAVTHQREPQMIIMGSHARTGLARAVFGSVAESVLRQSKIPVLIEPAGRHLEEHPSDAVVQAEAEQCG